MDIKEKRQEVARELRERAKGYLPFIDSVCYLYVAHNSMVSKKAQAYRASKRLCFGCNLYVA